MAEEGIPGIGKQKPNSRVLNQSMFSYVPDAFGNALPALPSERVEEEEEEEEEGENTRKERQGEDPGTIIPGMGAEPYVSRGLLNKSMFAYVPDVCGSAFPSFPSEQDYSQDIPGERGLFADEEMEEETKKQQQQQSAQNRIFIKGGIIVNDDQMQEGDVYIEDGIIKQVGKDLIIPGGTRTIDAKGKLVMPDDFYQGTKAALFGGTTTIVDLVVPDKNQSILEAYEEKRSQADGKACCDYALRVSVNTWSDAVRNDMHNLVESHGINCFLFTGDLQDAEMVAFLKECKSLGVLAQFLPEGGPLFNESELNIIKREIRGPEGFVISRPEILEEVQVGRAAACSYIVNVPLYVISVTGREAAEELAHKCRQGVQLYGEVLAAALATDGTHYWNRCWRHAAAHVTSPPLRPDQLTSAVLLNLLACGALHTVASAHCTFKASQKARGVADFRQIPRGVNGVEERLCVLWEHGVRTGRLDPCAFVASVSARPAHFLNIFPRKGCISQGSDADVIIWNKEITRTMTHRTHHSSMDFNVFEVGAVYRKSRCSFRVQNVTCCGAPQYVICGGRIVLEDDDLRVAQGVGQFLPLAPFAPFIYFRVTQRDLKRLPLPIEREPYDGPVDEDQWDEVTADGYHETPETTPEFHSRPPTRSGGRNMQDSTFSASGAQIDDKVPIKSTVKIKGPPGGASTGFW